LIFILVVDIPGFFKDLVNIPGLLGVIAMPGKFKIPELFSLFAVLHLLAYFCLRPLEFRQPLMGLVIWFIAAGTVGTVIGIQKYIVTNAMRDSLGHYFSFFYIIGVVLLPTLSDVRPVFRWLFWTALFAALVCYVIAAITQSTNVFYSTTYGMVFSSCAYFLIA